MWILAIGLFDSMRGRANDARLVKNDLPSVLASAGYQLVRWQNAREVLAARVAKRRLPEALQLFLERWLSAETVRHFPELTPEAPLTVTLMETAHAWQILSGGLAEVPLERALLHLPALRAFWSQELRREHFVALQALVPSVWMMDAAVVPPGAVIAGLNVTRWDAVRESERFEIQDGLLLSKMLPGNSVTAHYVRDERGRIVLRDHAAVG